MSSRRHALLALALLTACPAVVTPGQDAGPTGDAGRDGGVDAGPQKKDAGPPDAGFENVPLADWCASRATALCRRQLRCLQSADAGLERCLTLRLEECDQAALNVSAALGRLQYLPSAAGDCLDAYDTGACSGTPTACATVFTGLVPPDGGCAAESECTQEGYCYLYDGRCPHTCRPFLPLGAECDGFSLRCRPGEGACEMVDGGEQRCVAVRGAGEACPDFDSCRVDLACIDGQCIQRVAAAGEPCGLRSGYPLCEDEYLCHQAPGDPPPPGVCVRKAGVGSTCAGYASCLPSLRCSGGVQTGTCEPKGPLGHTCLNYGDCEDGLFCHPGTQRCTALPGPGGDCTARGSSYACAFGAFCDFSSPSGQYTCTALQTQGQRCSYDAQCLTNECEYGPLPDGGYGGACVEACSHRADAGT